MVGASIGGTDDRAAVVDAESGVSVSFSELRQQVSERASSYRDSGAGVAFLSAANTIEAVEAYLALREAAIPTLLLDPGLSDERFSALAAAYRPDLLVGFNAMSLVGYDSLDEDAEARLAIDVLGTQGFGGSESVSVLLPTSGSTGNPKFVQLTDENLNTNAADIIVSLGMHEDDQGLLPLPLFYSYGLSILNSHLALGATTVLTTASPIRREFWSVVSDNSISSIPGVPYSYALFQRARFLERDLSSLRYMTQAGGKLDQATVLEVHEGLSAHGAEFYVMYGQTEASPRICVLPSHEVPDHADTVGYPMASGEVRVVDSDASGSGEVEYQGPNVMIGYAETRSDLGLRTHAGVLSTGDLGRLDDAGRLVITGRMKRIAKLFGNRVSLQDIESHFAFLGPTAVVEGDNKLVVYHEFENDEAAASAKKLERSLKVPARTIVLVQIDELPRNSNGKIDYKVLAK